MRARSLVAEATQKRELFFQIALKSLRLDLEKRYAAKVGEDLVSLQAKIQGIIEAEDLYRKMTLWYAGLAHTGFGGGLKDKYLQFEKPLMLLRQDLEHGLRYQEKMANFSNVPSDFKATMEREIDGYIKALRVAVTDLEKGWEPIFERQKFLNSHRQGLAASLGAKCQNALEAYDKRAGTVKVITDFREVEPLYIQVVDTCRKEPQP